MIRNHFKRGKYEYEKYRCASRWRPFKTDCRGEGVSLKTIDEWAWAAVKSMVSGEDALALALAAVRPDELLVDDLETAKRERERASRAADALLSLARRDPFLLPHVEREASRAARERRGLEQAIAELESRTGGSLRRAADLRQLLDLNNRYRGNLDRFSFGERRLALRALGFKAHANGDDPARWRYEAGPRPGAGGAKAAGREIIPTPG